MNITEEIRRAAGLEESDSFPDQRRDQWDETINKLVTVNLPAAVKNLTASHKALMAKLAQSGYGTPDSQKAIKDVFNQANNAIRKLSNTAARMEALAKKK